MTILTNSHRPLIIHWLIVCCVMVALMVIVGGLTRLTESGLSIVEWKPVRGIVPPLTDAAWEEELEAYRASPQYQKINHGISVQEFKGIYWLEYIHRLLGRLIGIIFLVPYIWFMTRRALPPALAVRLGLLFALGGAQGVIGWVMVKSGLIQNPWVDPLLLMAHLALAFILFAFLYLTIEKLRDPAPARQLYPGWLYYFSLTLTFLIFVQAMLGALVAGNDAGLTYNTFPLMNGRFIPEGILQMQPVWLNFIHHIPMVQFNHRLMAYILSAAIAVFCFFAMRQAPGSRLSGYVLYLALALIVQFLLGFLTLIFVVPIPLAVLHQAGALLLFMISLKISFHLSLNREHAVKLDMLPSAQS